MKSNEKNAKIYSRPRINIKILNKNKKREINKKKVKGIKVMVVIIIATITAVLIIKSINPIIDNLCINEAQNIATKIASEQSIDIMKQYNYNDLVTITRDNNNNISMIQANINTINTISSEIPDKIIDEFKDNSNSNIYIYLGSILGLKIFSGSGPRIQAKIANTSNVQSSLKSEFTSSGINQTLHRIYLELQMNVSILTPYNTITTTTTEDVLLAESIIVGNVPSSYYNLNNPTPSDAIRSTNK